MSERTSGSAFSLMESAQEVCWTKMLSSPVVGRGDGRWLRISVVIRWHPRRRGWRENVVCCIMVVCVRVYDGRCEWLWLSGFVKIAAVVVRFDDAYGLDEGVDDGGADELHAMFLEVFAEGVRQGRRGDCIFADERFRRVER